MHCSASNSAGTAVSKLVVMPNAAPVINSLDYDHGGNVFCNTSGYPLPAVTIQHPNGTLTEDSQIDGKWANRGSYQCTATNMLGQSSIIKDIGGLDLIAIACIITALTSLFLTIFLCNTKE